MGLGFRVSGSVLGLVAEWVHSRCFGIILPTMKLKVYTFRGL